MTTSAAPRTSSETPSFEWRRWPETEAAVDAWIAAALDGNAFARRLAERMRGETSTRFQDWTDHLVLSERPGLPERLAELGYVPAPHDEALDPDSPAHHHPGGIFPKIVLAPDPARSAPEVRAVGIKTESVADFSAAHNLGLRPSGFPLGPYRAAVIPGASVELVVLERRGYQGFQTQGPPEQPRDPAHVPDALRARELWRARQRVFEDDAQGFDQVDRLLDEMIQLCRGPALACHLVFEVERQYWESRNRAARVQKFRQDRLGLGWANHDHHTFRCSRRFFPRVMAAFQTLGFHLRERFHAGEHAGWGAQVLEDPRTGIVIFADLDLTPDELRVDFTRISLPDLPRPNTVGLWVALHGESLLDAGMHHLEAQFEFDHLRESLKAEAGLDTMKPFSDFPFLRQAFTAGEIWNVRPARADRALQHGWITPDERERFVREGALGSHLENLQRREGYKGFNQRAVGLVIAATDPRLAHAPNP